MNAKLAAQVLCFIVSNSLLKYGPREAAGTEKFSSLMDMFFVIMNIRDINSHSQEVTILVIFGFRMFSCNILKIG